MNEDRDPLSGDERRLAEHLRRPARSGFGAELRRRFLAGDSASQVGHEARTARRTPAPENPAPPARIPTGSPPHSTRASELHPVTPLSDQDRRLASVLQPPAARPAFRADLRDRFRSGTIEEPVPAPAGRVIRTHRFGRGWALGSALLAAAAALLIFLGPLGGRPAPQWQVLAPVVQASYGDSEVVAGSFIDPGRALGAGEQRLRLTLGQQDGSAPVRAEVRPNTRTEVGKPCWLDGSCLEAGLAMQDPGEILLIADASQHPIEARVATPEGEVTLLDGALSVRRYAAGTCVVLSEGRARITAVDGEVIELAGGHQVFLGTDGSVKRDESFCAKSAEVPEIEERIAPLRQARADAADGIF